jgi:hypothetical protein
LGAAIAAAATLISNRTYLSLLLLLLIAATTSAIKTQILLYAYITYYTGPLFIQKKSKVFGSF